MPEEEHKHSELKSEIAENRPRDDEGHFISQEKIEEHEKKGVIDKLFSENVHYSKSQDDLLDVHVGNPLRKIYLLLQDIKNQKVLSVSAKASFGIMGVAVAIGIISIFGVSNVFCAKGVQSEIGVIKTLNIDDKTSSNIPVIGSLFDWFSARTNPQTHARVVLVRDDNSTIRLPYSKNVNVVQYQNMPVIVTGNYDACNSTLTVNEESGVETFFK